MKIEYLPHTNKIKTKLINEYSIEDEINSLENVISNNSDRVKINRHYTLTNGKKLEIYKRSYNVSLSSNIVIGNILEMYFIKVNGIIFITDLKFKI